MSSERTRFATAINCIDGRTQIPVTEWMKAQYGVDFVDMVTEPGPDRILSENMEAQTLEWVRSKIDVSVAKHGSKLVAVVGHHDCAGNPVDKKTHLTQILDATKTVESWGLGVRVVGLWVGDHWNVEQEIHLKP